MKNRIDLRLGLKLPVTMDIYVNAFNQKIVFSQTGNISFTGAFVHLGEADLPVDFSIRRSVDLCLYNSTIGEIRINGLIVRRTDQGVGILFNNYDEDIGLKLGTLMSLYLENKLYFDAIDRTTEIICTRKHQEYKSMLSRH